MAKPDKVAAGLGGIEMPVGRVEDPVEVSNLRRVGRTRWINGGPPPQKGAQEASFVKVPEFDRCVVAAADQRWQPRRIRPPRVPRRAFAPAQRPGLIHPRSPER